MRVAFVGKGGSGKTTMSSLFARYATTAGPVVAIDADINQHLGLALGIETTPPPMGAQLTEIKDYLRGDNPLIPSAAAMVKTTPPGRGSRQPTIDDLFFLDTFAVRDGDLHLMATGPFSEDDLGVACYHSKIGAVELYLNHLVDGHGEYVVVDMTAGADSFASGLFTRFDLTFLVAEPTRQGIGVYQQYREYAAGFDVPLAVIGNKVQSPADLAFLRDHVGDALLATMTHSPAIRAMEQGHAFTLHDLEPTNLATLATMLTTLDAQEKNWPRFARQTAEFHRKNAHSWANLATGTDLTTQIDPHHQYGPAPAHF
ncbi:hypothetical protein GCM10009555_022100 [Acrocarpospora macrocephala]|uniref:ATP-binding protein n=1 Tax=Acrocarpospora macrocephala TaxID=150177 RepID=A0A5M3WV86_9ACTN|nr:ATP-binding protein [Acrocarpospora macrocephala]GES12142.1 ATP-binding protein [Acrocarpospora macrocephala]